MTHDCCKDFPVKTHLSEKAPWVEIVNIDCEPRTLDSTGPAQIGCSLTVKGCVADVELILHDHERSLPRVRKSPFLSIGLTSVPTGFEGWETRDAEMAHMDNPVAPLGHPFVEGQEANRVLCLRMGFGGVDSSRMYEYFMLLQPVSWEGLSDSELCYQRVGFLSRIWHRDWRPAKKGYAQEGFESSLVFEGGREMVLRIF